MKKIFFLLLFVLIASATVKAQTEEPEGNTTESTEEYTEESEHSNDVGLFLGATSFTGEGSWTAFTVGAEYERAFEFTPEIFLGWYGEYVTGDHSEFVTGIPVGVSFSNIKFFLAPSVAFEKEEAAPLEETETNLKESTTKFFLRLGTGYKFEFGNFSMTPQIAADIISSKVFVVYGVSFGLGF